MAQSVVHEPFGRLMKRYSALALQLPPSAVSTPAPAVHPAPDYVGCRAVREVGSDVAKSRTASAVDEAAVECITQAAAHRGKPIVFGQTPGGAEGCRCESTEVTRSAQSLRLTICHFFNEHSSRPPYTRGK